MVWKKLNEEFIKKIDNQHIKSILKSILEKKEFFFSLERRGEKTNLLKTVLINLGHNLGYKVYANGLNKKDLENIKIAEFVNREYLCDLVWYTEPDRTDYITTSLKLAMECEWDYNRKEDKNKNNYSAMKYDFQKLVVIKTEFRLMIFKLKSSYNDDLGELKEYFDKALQSFKNLDKNFNLLVIGVVSNKKNNEFMVLNYHNYNIK